jgi:hypothetical protein
MQKHSFTAFPVVLFLLAAFTSCNKSEVTQEVFVDSYIHSYPSQSGVPVYTIMHTAYSFSMMNSIGVTGSATPVKQLVPFSPDGLSFYNKPDSATYKTTVPAAETFTYNVIFSDGNIATRSNSTGTKSVAPVQQLAVKKTPAAAPTDLTLTWKAATSAEAYKIRIFHQDPATLSKVLIYESNFLVPKDNATDLSIPFPLNGLTLYALTDLFFEVSAFIFEEGKDTYQSVSITQIRYSDK